MPTLHDSLQALAEILARGVLDALRDTPLDELFGSPEELPAREPPASPAPTTAARLLPQRATKRTRSARRGRGAIADVAPVVQRILALLKGHPEGLRAERLRAELGLERAELTEPIASALSRKQISRRGKKRGTTYFLGTGSSSPARDARVAERPARRPARKRATPRPVESAAKKNPQPTSKKKRDVTARTAGKRAAPLPKASAAKSGATPKPKNKQRDVTKRAGRPVRKNAAARPKESAAKREPAPKPKKKREAYVYITEAGLAAERGEVPAALPASATE